MLRHLLPACTRRLGRTKFADGQRRDEPLALTHPHGADLTQAEWRNSTILKSDVTQAVSKLKNVLGGDLLVAGSRTLVNTSSLLALARSGTAL